MDRAHRYAAPVLISLLGLLATIPFQNCSRFASVGEKSSSSTSGEGGQFLSEEQREGKIIYEHSCKSCHGALEDSVLRDRVASEISLAILHVPTMNSLSYLVKNGKDMEALEAYLGSAIACKDEPRTWQASRLTGIQIQYTLFDILGVDINRQFLPSDGVRGSFQNNVELFFDISALQSYIDFVEKSESILLPAFKTKFVNCQQAATACLKTGFKGFAESAFRGTLSTPEVDQLYSVYAKSQGLGASHDEALTDVMTYVLINARFLYPYESSRAVGILLPGREIANRLALLIWSSIPDATLLARAADGSLGTNDGIKSEIARMLTDTKGERFRKVFMGGWVGLRGFLDKIPVANSNDQNFQMETLMFFENALSGGSSPIDIFQSDYTYVNKTLATHYGLPGNFTNQFTKVSLANTNRKGLLTQGSFLSSVANSTFATVYKRGNHVLQYVLCNKALPQPPGITPIVPGSQDPNLTEAELALKHRNKAESCYACHARMDPIGLSLARFDQFASEKPGYASIPIDLTTMPDGSQLGTSAKLASYLATGNRLQACFVSGLNNYVYSGYQPSDVRCASEAYHERVNSKPISLGDWITSVVTDSVLQPK